MGTQGKQIIRVLVPYGEDRPYAINDNQIYVRDEGETSLAVRDEIVNLVRQGLVFLRTEGNNGTETPMVVAEAIREEILPTSTVVDDNTEIAPPRAGAEIADVEDRNDTRYYMVRDLRNGNIVKNVTRDSARRLWHYAIRQFEGNPVKEEKVQWSNGIGLWRRYK